MAIDWNGLDRQTVVTVPARPASGLWTLVRSYLSSPQIIRIGAEGSWTAASGLPSCGPDGLPHWAFGRDALLFKKAPLGALIGKIGGSIAGVDDRDVFLVGSASVLTIDKSAGPLFLTINDAPGFFEDNTGALTVAIALLAV
jgi:hypothetical protein